MKKEMFAVVLLLAIFIAGLINIRCLDKLTGELMEMSENASDASSDGDWERAEKYSGMAVERWRGMDSYTHIVLRHSEIDAVSDSLYELLKETQAGNSGSAEAAAAAAVYHLISISGMERIRLGSIF